MERLAELQNEYKGLDRDQLLKLVLSLKSENAELKKHVYSSKRENRILHAKGQGKLFNEAEHYLGEAEEEEAGEGANPASKDSSDDPKPKPRKKKKALSDKLPRVQKIIDLADDEKVCSKNGGLLKKVGETVVEKLEFIPSKAVVIAETTINYKCDCCEENNFHSPVKEPSPIPGSFATASLISAVLTYKFVDGLPLYRQQRIFGRFGVEISRTTLASWVVKAGKPCSTTCELHT